MKIIINVNDNNPKEVYCKVGSKIYGLDMPISKQEHINNVLRQFLIDNTQLTDYEEDCMWMSYRYCIGRHTGASTMHAENIWKNCKGRMSSERELFTAFDINREIERCLSFIKPYFHFPLTSLNKIYTSAVDIVCEFMEDYNIKSIEDFIKYRDIHVILTDNERGYKFETVTWEEWLRPKVWEIVSNYYGNKDMSQDFAWKYFETWKSGKKMEQEEMIKAFEKLTIDMPKAENYYFHDLEDLFVWNDLVHAFDWEHHHKSVLIDNSTVEWFWTWTENVELHDDGHYYKAFGYKKVRVPIDKWKANICTYIPNESIIKDLY